MLKKIFGAAVKGHMMRAVDYAADEGVPRGFSIPLMKEVTLVSQVVKLIGKNVPDIRMLDVYQQYGIALKALYEKHLSEIQDAASIEKEECLIEGQSVDGNENEYTEVPQTNATDETSISATEEEVDPIESTVSLKDRAVICPSCGLMKRVEYVSRGNNINIKCAFCEKIYSANKNTFDSVRCPECGEKKALKNIPYNLKNMSTKCVKCCKTYKMSTNIYVSNTAKEECLMEDQGVNGNENEYFETYEDAIVFAKMNPGKVVKRSPNRSGFILTNMEQI